jgi:rRNA-processing protein FCF1
MPVRFVVDNSVYDASYLDLAMRLGLPIATQDTSLARAAKKCRVPAFDPKGKASSRKARSE